MSLCIILRAKAGCTFWSRCCPVYWRRVSYYWPGLSCKLTLLQSCETGTAAQYWSWRGLHYSIAAGGFLEMYLVYFSFPETSHPGTMGIEKVARSKRFHIPWINPLNSLWLLRSPNLFATVSALLLCTIRIGCKLRVHITDACSESYTRQ